MTEIDQTRITFPCDQYPIKVVARASEDLRTRLDAVFSQHFGPVEPHRVVARDSAQRNFISFTYLMHVNDPSQLSAVHVALMAEAGVVMVL